MRSPEQQARIDKLVKFLKTYKGKSVNTDVIAEKIEKKHKPYIMQKYL